MAVDTNDLLEALAGTDYTAITSQPAVIAAGTTTTTVTENVIGDEIVEIDETFTLDLSAAIFDGGADATRVNIGDSSGLGTIINDDSALLIIDDVTLAEGDSVTTDFVFTITSDLVSSKDLGVTVDTNDLLEALAGTDYTAIASQPAVITAGTTATTVTVSVIGDEIVEIDETFTLDLSDAIFDGGSDTTRVNIGDSSGRGTIVNDDSALLIIDDVTLAEGDSGTTDFVFTISSDLQSSKDLGVTVDTNDLLEAIAGTDYTAITSQPAVIAAGTTTTTVTVSVIGDEIVEIDETFAVDLSNAVFNGGTDTTRVNIDDASGLGTIVNDDSALLSINDVALTEGDSGTTDFVFTINSDLESSKDLGVTVDTNDLLEALAGIDYSAITSQPAVIKAGTTTTTVTVSVIGDEIVEIDETFTVDLSAATFDSGADITRVNIGDASGLGTIINDDSALLSIDDVTVAEGDAGTTDFVFTISSDLQSSKDLGVTVDTNDLLEAIAGTDYTAITSQPALITAGTTTTTVTVSVIGDDIVELDETFTVDLSDAIFNGGTDSTRVNIGDAIGLGTIVNDDSALLSVNDVTLAEGDSGTTDFVFTIRSDLESSKGLGVTVDTNDLLEAIVGTDYTAITSQTAVIDAGTTTTTVTVSVISDEIVEIDETFTVDLSDVIFNGGTDTTRVNIDDASGLGTIVNDDSALLSIDDVTLAEGDSGTTDFVFTISSDLESSKDLGVAVETNDLLEAIAVTDYTAITSQPAVITAGSTTTTVTVSVIGDEIVEIDETFTVDLSDAVFGGGTDTTRVNIDDSSGLGTIVNDDSTLLSINDVTLAEGDSGTTDFVFTITSELESSKDLGVTVDTNDLLEAIAGTDYSAITPQSAVITAGTTTTTVTVSVIGDEVVEIEETFTLDLSAATFDGNDDATRVSIDDASGLGTIINDDMASIMIDDVSMTEGDSGMTSFVFTIRSDLAASRDLGVVVNAADLGNLIGGADLVDVSDASVSIAAGSTSATFTIQVLGDSVVEADEVFLVDIESPTFGSTADASRVTIADNQAMGTIVNDDIATLAINDVAVIEGDVGSTSVTFTVSADNLSSMNTSVTARTIDGFQAIEGIDYLGILEQEVVILAGQSTATLTIDVIGDSIVELDETYQVELSNALFGNTSDASRIRIGDAIGVGTIMNDDSAAITIEDVTAIEGDFGITDFVFTIRQDQLASLDTSVTVNTIDIQQAIEGVDYNAITNQIVTIAAGTQTATLSVGVIGESLVEATEAFRVELSDARFGDSADATRITLGVTTATGTILNDDAGDFLVEDLVVNESDGVAELTVGLANPVDTDVTLEFSLDTNPDIENLNSQILFRAGVSQPQSIRIAITNDVLVEGTESYIGFFELMTRDGENDITATVATSIEIIDDDRATFDVGDVTMDEAAGTISLEVAIDAPFDIDATFDLTAPAQDDLTLVNPTITFGSGSTNSQTVVIALNDDSLVELDEFVDLTLVPQTELGDRDLDLSDRGQVQIIDNDTATFMAEDLRVREGDGTVLLTVSVDNPIDVDTVFSIVLGPNDDILIQTPTITFAGGSDQSQSFSLELIDDTVEELPERIGAVAILETDLGTRSIVAPESVVVNLRDNDTPDFLQDLNEGLLTTSVPILAPTTGTGGNAPGSGPGNGPANNPTGNQPAGDAPADGPSDAVAAEVFAGTEQVTATGTIGQESSLRSTQSSTQSTSGSDGGSEFDDADSTRAKGTSTDSEFESDVGELLFHVVLPNGKLGKKFELDIDLLNEDESSLFDRFRGLPTDVYRVLYREPGSDTFQQLFEIYVVDGKIETLLYSQDAPVEKIDPADDADVPQPGDEPDAVGQDVAQPSADDVSHADSTSEWGRLAVPALAASLVLAKPRGMRSVMSHSVGDPNPSVVKMDHVSRTMRRLAGAIGR
ncbi:MAG: Calx-beta domain-containing protein [Planctomycetota bacterium]